jgi:hypothetical protein
MRRRELKPRWQRGIVLITTLAIVVFLVMLSSMLITTAYTSLKSTTSLYDSDRAYQAAMAGVTFIQATLQDNIDFMAYGLPYTDFTPRTDSTGQFTLTCSQGVIIGTDTKAGTQFRISFNPNLVSDTSVAPLGCDYTSVNHMSGVNADQDGSKSPYVAPCTLYKGNAYGAVQKRTCTVIAEGFDLTGSTTSSVTNPLQIVYTSRRVVEANFYRDMTGVLNSVVQSGGNLQLTANTNAVGPTYGDVTINKASGVAGMPNVRTLQNMTVNAHAMGNYSDTVGNVLLNNANTAKLQPANSNLPGQSNVGSQATNAAQFLGVTYAKATSQFAGYGSSTLTGGSYCFWSGQTTVPSYYPDLVYDRADVLPSGQPRYQYLFDSTGVWSQTNGISWDGGAHANTIVQVDYSFNPPIATAFPPGAYPPSNTPSFALASDPNHPEYKWQMNVPGVQTVGGAYNPTEGANNSFAVLTAGFDPNTNAINSTSRLNVNFQSTGSAPAAILNPTDSIAVRGDLSGSGNMMAYNNLSFEGHSTVYPNSNSVVSLYAGNNVIQQAIIALPPTGGVGNLGTGTAPPPPSGTGNFQDQNYYGLVYAGNGFGCNVLDPTTDSVTLQGALVAFGNSAIAGNGAAVAGTSGGVNVNAYNITLTYDPTNMGALYDLFPNNAILRTTYIANY